MFVGGSATSFAELPKFVGKRSRPHQIVSRASQSVRTQLSREALFPQMAVQAYSLTAAVPPDHDGQRLVSFDTDGQADRIDDKTDPSRKLVQQFERISRPVSPSRFRFEVTMVFDLFERRLVKQSGQQRRVQDVVDKDLPNNELVVAQGGSHPLLLRRRLRALQLHWITSPSTLPFVLQNL